MATKPAGAARPLPRPHRCNDRLEDAIQGLFEGSPRTNFWPLAQVAWRCFQTQPGEEPTEPYRYVTVTVPASVPAAAQTPAAGVQVAEKKEAAAGSWWRPKAKAAG